jgi:predicted AAA+ superfamily ATPase
MEEKLSSQEMWRGFLRGSYPELIANPGRDTNLWHASYVETYLERDVRTIRQVGNLTQFQSFLRALAARTAQLLDLSSMARDLGIAVNTVKAWLSVLEATYQVIILRPYFTNVGKRLVKTPKVYFTDTGTLCYLTGLKDPEHAASGPMGGAIMETAVVSEIVKTLTHQGVDPQVYFWRTAAGSEVDLIVGSAGSLVPIEVKLSATPSPVMTASIRRFQEDLGERAMPGYVVHPGDVRLPLGKGVTALPFAEL